MNLASILENQDIEKRIAITPKLQKNILVLGLIYHHQKIMVHTRISDDEYKNLESNF